MVKTRLQFIFYSVKFNEHILKDDEDFLVDNEEEMDIKEEMEIKQDSTKEYLGKLQYKVEPWKKRVYCYI